MNPRIIKLHVEGYKKKEEIEFEKTNIYSHLQGQYFLEALYASVGNMFKPKSTKPHEYPKKPYERQVSKELSEEEKREQTEKLFMSLRLMEVNFNATHKSKDGSVS